jgi:tRNA (guanine-N7-)-methyltransferase
MQARLPDLALAQPPPSSGYELAALAPPGTGIWLEIGFGGGEHMAAQAAAHPDRLILGAEPFLNGVASAVRHIDAVKVSNIRIYVGDARVLVAALPPACLERVFILFPDPWPKLRQRKRRLINDQSINDLGRVLKPGGRLRFVTDWADYAEETLRAFLRSAAFHWTAETAQDWLQAPEDHVSTRYEVKGLGDIKPLFFDFVRR